MRTNGFKNAYFGLSNLKDKLLDLARENRSVYFFSSGSYGDRAIFYSYLTAYQTLTGLNPVVVSLDKPDVLAELFLGLKGGSLVVPKGMIDNCPIRLLPFVLGDPNPGEGAIYFTGCANYQDGMISNSWLRRNHKDFNVYALTKLILGLPSPTCPEQISMLALMANVSPKFTIRSNRYVLLAPHSASCPELLPLDFWLPMVRQLRASGFECVVNLPPTNEGCGFGTFEAKEEFSAAGAEIFSGGFLDLLAMAVHAFHVITIRSGLADLMNLLSRVQFSVVYPPCFSHVTEYFGVKNSLGFPPVEELLVHKSDNLEKAGLDLVSRVLV